MKQLDVLYRAFLDYKKQTAQSTECNARSRAVISSNPNSDVLCVQRNICTVSEDWIIAIEEGLVHVEKAIDEARQFIRTEGEVIPIEKAKRVSKDTVRDLAKHSDFITKAPKDGEDLIPDRLYIVSRLSDFAVYENRFLYMLLCYLKDFVDYRYNKILELTNTYYGDLSMNKSIVFGNSKMSFELKIAEQKLNDRYLRENNPLEPIITRIDALQKTVMFLLMTPLMQEVSKASLLKPPITKTNVLKTNNNFKGAVALYEFVKAYDGQGFAVETIVQRTSPLSDIAADDFSQIVMLSSYLVYKHGLSLEKLLKHRFDEQEELRNQALLQAQRQQLNRLKRRIEESGMEPYDYMLLLEKRNKALELDSAALASAKQEIARQNEQIAILMQNISLLEDALKESERQAVLLKQKHAEEIASISSCYEEKILEINKRYTDELQKKNENITELSNKMIHERDEFVLKAERTEAEHVSAISDLNAEHTAEIERLVAQNQQKSAAFEQLEEQKTLLDARLLALKSQYNLILESEDFTSKEAFEELERQYNALKRFFKGQWSKTKKRIRKEVLRPEKKSPNDPSEMAANSTESKTADGMEVSSTQSHVRKEEDIWDNKS